MLARSYLNLEILKFLICISRENFSAVSVGRMFYNVCVYAVRGIGGFKNEAQRNVKPDMLRTVPRYRTKLRNYF
jgi:hypothetical protein